MTRTPERIKIVLSEIEQLWNKQPDQRFGQLLFNYTRIGTRTEVMGTVRDPFFYDDEDILKDLKRANKGVK